MEENWKKRQLLSEIVFWNSSIKRGVNLPVSAAFSSSSQLLFEETIDSELRIDIVAGGTDTSSKIIIWALLEMMKNPNIMANAQSEVRQVFQEKKNYDEGDLEKSKYLKLAIKETLRLHPPIPLVPKECKEQTDIDGYTIRCKTNVLVNIWALGRDPESWDDPESFIPERFENSSINFMGNHYEFIPFGAGRRSCPGMLFGLAAIEVALAQLLHHFEWQLPYGTNPQDLDMTETPGLTAAKQKDLYLVAVDHRNDDEF
ncbi:cytochrome P450 71D7-like [Lycium ferocissimum]|uniref:cytochrome P450 71D7-like n=1 Tax=Lycium ferocissimum TaxID=112874 RepID=UPI002814E27F|nr:cytochrome P450 71D7-like [Lycium ferocissimum]